MPQVGKVVELGFEKTHELKELDGTCKFEAVCSKAHMKDKGFSHKACVYIWASPINDDELDVIYVGKAGGGVSLRMSQHEAGFRHSGTGKKNQRALKSLIETGKQVHVYSRVADTVNLFDVEVSQYSTEEEALIDHLSPWLNRARVINKSDASLEEKEELSIQDEFVIAGVDELPHADEVRAFVDSLPLEEKRLFANLLEWATNLYETKPLSQKVIGGYTGQPLSLSRKQLLNFTSLGKSGRALGNSWRVRLSLEGKVAVILPVDFLNKSISIDKIDVIESTNTFSPKDVGEFLSEPSAFTTMR
jgi:hypothetical protein